MDYKWLMSRFDGRINRARYWLATLIILGAMISALLLLAVICLGAGIPTGPLTINVIGVSASFDLVTDAGDNVSPLPQVISSLLTLVYAWFYAAVSIKRLHDRNKSGWWLIPFVAATGLYSQFGHWLGGSWAAVVVGFAVSAAFIWGTFEMFFVRGTCGPNRFGSDPLAPVAAAKTQLRWDQQSEMEFVPHSAGPSPGAHVKRGA